MPRQGDSSMHIFNIIQCANLGGMEQSTLALLNGLQARGHQVELLSLNPLGAMGPLLAERSVPAVGLAYRGRGGWRSVSQLRRRLSRVNSDALIMTGHNLLAMIALGNLCRGRRLLSIHFHHAGVKPAWQWRLIYRVARTRFSAIAFPTDFIRREAETLYPPIKAISHTIGCPIAIRDRPTASERASARLSLGLPPQALIVGNAGWLIPRKRFDIFLKVARLIAAAERHALFAIAGDGPEAERLRRLAGDLGIADRVRWLGWQSDVTSFYRSLDLAVFNTDWDALGRTPLEALGAGVPVVASVVHGGLHEILDREHYGPVFASHDLDRMAEAALMVLRDPEAAASLVTAGQQRLEQVASERDYTERVCRLLEGHAA